VRRDYPVTGIREHCNQAFLSRSPNLDSANHDVQVQFGTYKCNLIDSSQNEQGTVHEPTEDK
jgi:hypothetical protein